MPSQTADVQALIDGIRAGSRAALARAITLVESTLPTHRSQADQLIAALLPQTGGAIRVGVSGPPGVGKSTFIEQLGVRLCDEGRKVAVLAVDPSSTVRGGSILGDKTRMATLAQRTEAFVRPSPSGGSLGGVHDRSRDALLLCEAAGYDVVLVETVGVGQSETAVAALVDTVVVLLLPGAGDELQGIKKGLLEIADVLAVNKADGDNALRARRTRKDYKAALHLVRPRDPGWTVPVLLCSGLAGDGVDEVWQAVLDHRQAQVQRGALEVLRQRQQVGAMWAAVHRGLLGLVRERVPAERVHESERRVRAGELPPSVAAQSLIDAALHAG